jgi:hypothetical protein
MSRLNRVLDDKMEKEFMEGTLKPLLEVVKRDRDLVLEFRDPSVADIYCKGQCLEIERCGGGYKISAHEKFLNGGSLMLGSAEAADLFVKEKLPFVKQRMAELRSAGMEIEFEQALIRANNLEAKLNTDYFAVDSQVFLGSGQDHIDVLGIYWPDHRSDEEISLALIEVKFGLNGGIDKLAEQVERYYDALTDNISRIASHTQVMLQQKLRMGLITGGSAEALRKLKRLNISDDAKCVKIVVAMVDYDLRSTLLRAQIPKLRDLKSKKQLKNPIEVIHLGYGLWSGNAVRDLNDIPPSPDQPGECSDDPANATISPNRDSNRAAYKMGQVARSSESS